MKLLVLCFMAVVWCQLPSEGEATCCMAHVWKKIHTKCNDCKSGTPYCGIGDCNVFGCNCEGGCRTGSCTLKRSVSTRSLDAHRVIRAADVDGDGRMSVEEARRHLTSTGLEEQSVKRALAEMDADKDNYISRREIDSD